MIVLEMNLDIFRSLDNRRLYVFKEAAKKGAFYQIPVIDTSQSEVSLK